VRDTVRSWVLLALVANYLLIISLSQLAARFLLVFWTTVHVRDDKIERKTNAAKKATVGTSLPRDAQLYERMLHRSCSLWKLLGGCRGRHVL
jgi:hypothetical protein